MKLDFNRRYTTVAVYAFLVLAATVLFITLIFNIPNIRTGFSYIVGLLTPFILGFVFAYLLNPVMGGIEKLLFEKLLKGKASFRLKRVLSLLLTYLVVFGVIALFLAAIIPQIATSLSSIWGKIPDYIKSVEEWIGSLNNSAALETNQNVLSDLISHFADSFEELLQQVYDLLGKVLPTLFNFTSRLTSGVMNFGLGIIVSIYMLYQKEHLIAQAKKLLYVFFSRERADSTITLARSSHATFSRFIIGKFFDSLIIGIICFICMTIIGFPYPTLNSLIIGVTNIIPFFGPIFGAIPTGIIVLMAKPEMTIWYLLFILILQQFDGNILGPRILGKSTGMSALFVIFAIVLFGGMFGVVGMFIGVPIFAVLYALARAFIQKTLKKKNLPVSTDAYDISKNPQPFTKEEKTSNQ